MLGMTLSPAAWVTDAVVRGSWHPMLFLGAQVRGAMDPMVCGLDSLCYAAVLQL